MGSPLRGVSHNTLVSSYLFSAIGIQTIIGYSYSYKLLKSYDDIES